MAREAENKRQGVPIGADYWRHGSRWILARIAEGQPRWAYRQVTASRELLSLGTR